jgi:phosphate transport system substrate-binding protein
MRTRTTLTRLLGLGVLAAALALPVSAAESNAALDGALRPYVKVGGVSGKLSSIGSDTMNNLMTLWAESFKKLYPNVSVEVQGAGSSTAPPAVTEGTASFGPMSRAMKEEEIRAFRQKHGYAPTGVRVAIDALAVFVHKDNPIRSLTIQQVDAIFSTTRRCGAPAAIQRWGQLGLTGSWANRPMQLYGRNSVSGTYGFFKQEALCSGDFRNNVNEQPGSASVVQSVGASLNGIGYSGIGYRTSAVRLVPISPRAGAPAIEPTAQNAANNRYPLHRYLYVYINKKPGTPLRPLEREFLNLVLSRTGQEVVVKDGYVPLTSAMIARELQRLR